MQSCKPYEKSILCGSDSSKTIKRLSPRLPNVFFFFFKVIEKSNSSAIDCIWFVQPIRPFSTFHFVVWFMIFNRDSYNVWHNILTEQLFTTWKNFCDDIIHLQIWLENYLFIYLFSQMISKWIEEKVERKCQSRKQQYDKLFQFNNYLGHLIYVRSWSDHPYHFFCWVVILWTRKKLCFKNMQLFL